MIDTERNLLTLRGEKIDELVTSVVVMKKGMQNDDWPEEAILLPSISRESYSRTMCFRPNFLLSFLDFIDTPPPSDIHDGQFSWILATS